MWRLRGKKPSQRDTEAQAKFMEKERRKLSAEEEIEAAVQKSSVREKKTELRKRKIKWAIGAAAFLLFCFVMYLLFVPFKGSKAFGVCKVFLEQRVQFPTHLRLVEVEEFSNWVRIWYTQTDSFGAYRLEPIQCFYRFDETLGYHVLDKVTIRRREVDQKAVNDFNLTIPLLLENPPDLTIPPPLPDTLRNLRFDVNKFIKPIL